MDYTNQYDTNIQSYAEKELSFLKVNSKLPDKLHKLYLNYYNHFQNNQIIPGDLSK